jgi:hypothetical protein
MDKTEKQAAPQLHDFGEVWPDSAMTSEFAMTPPLTRVPQDSVLVRRVMDSYRQCRNALPKEGTWHAIFMAKLQPIDEVLASRDVEKAAVMLREPAASTLFYGFDDIVRDFQSNWVTTEQKEGSRVWNSRVLLRLAEAIGAVRFYNREAAVLNVMPDVTPDRVLDAFEDLVGSAIVLPNVYPCEPGLKTSRGVLSYRTIQALYAIARIHTILGSIRGKRILEIGAGLGRTAYFGITCGAARYDIVDMPLTAASQGYFLGRVLGEQMVRLQGESASHSGDVPVSLLSAEEFLGSTTEYDMVVNIDSLPEIPEAICEQYILRSMRTSPLFFSINHESNAHTVKGLFDRLVAIKPVRYPCWVRVGYAEELYARPGGFGGAGNLSARLSAKLRAFSASHPALRKLVPQGLRKTVRRVVEPPAHS